MGILHILGIIYLLCAAQFLLAGELDRLFASLDSPKQTRKSPWTSSTSA
jgi:hypothetical protein